MASTTKPKKAKPSPQKVAAKTPRKRPVEVPKHQTLRLTKKRIKSPKKLPKILATLRASNDTLRRNKKLFLGLALVYATLNFVLIQGLGSEFSIVETKNQLQEVIGSESDTVATSFSLFGYLVGSFNGQVGEVAGTYQVILTLITILAVIWVTRQVLSGQKPSIKDGYYKGMYPIIPFLLVLLVIGLQLVPALVGNLVYNTVISQGLAIGNLEALLWLLFYLLLCTLSVYMIISSVFALYIVTLPDIMPLQALRSARELVLHRRIGVLARIIVLPIIGLTIALILFIPLLMIVPPLVEPVFLLASSVGLVYVNVYMYNLYRGLL